jgi:hypothetical protein
MGPTGAIAETMPRQVVSESVVNNALASGTLNLFAVFLNAGQLVSNITFVAGTTSFTAATHYWFALYSAVQSGPTLLAVSADQTSTAWALSTAKTLPMVTAYRVPTSGIYYVGIAMVATTAITVRGNTVGASVVSSLAPMLRCTSTTGITTTMPTTGTTVASAGFTAYAYVS